MNIVLGDLEYFESRQNFRYRRCMKFKEVKGPICKMRKERAIRLTKFLWIFGRAHAK